VFLYLLDQGTHRSEIWTFPNLVVFWGGLVAMAASVVSTVRTRSAAIGVVLLGAAIQYVPWMTVSRVTFMYHYLAVVPFLAIALAWWLVIGLRDVPHQREIAIGVSVAAVLFFFAILPMLVGWSMPISYLDDIRHLFPWVIR
jgi:dolichyl-phosphate-mannose--protein O-mannosyl transferase